jgi:hypothetical protein
MLFAASEGWMDAQQEQHLAFLPGRDPSHALCVKVAGDRPSFDPPQCVNVGGDRPTWRPPSNLTVTAVSELKIGKIFLGRPNASHGAGAITHEP